MGELVDTNVTIDADEEWMKYKSVPLEPLPMDDTPDAAAADVTPVPFLPQFNADVKTCEACKAAQQASDDEYMDDHVAWCDEHRAQFTGWCQVRRESAADVTALVEEVINAYSGACADWQTNSMRELLIEEQIAAWRERLARALAGQG